MAGDAVTSPTEPTDRVVAAWQDRVVAAWRDGLRRAAASAERDRATGGRHEPRRDDDVARWLKRKRDEHVGRPSPDHLWHLLDGLLDDYRDHADTGTPLDAVVEGPHPEEN
jgi:hypothetical protein